MTEYEIIDVVRSRDNRLIRHDSGTLYIVLGFEEVRMDGIWSYQSFVRYVSARNGKMYSRHVNDFESFMEMRYG